MAEIVVVMSYDLYRHKTLEKGYPGVQSGYTYDDGMAAYLAEASKQWYEKSGDDDIDQFEPLIGLWSGTKLEKPLVPLS